MYMVYRNLFTQSVNASRLCCSLLWFLTDLYGGLPPQQQFQTLAVVGQAAVVQRCAAFGRLLIQIQTDEGHRQREEHFKSQHRSITFF